MRRRNPKMQVVLMQRPRASLPRGPPAVAMAAAKAAGLRHAPFLCAVRSAVLHGRRVPLTVMADDGHRPRRPSMP